MQTIVVTEPAQLKALIMECLGDFFSDTNIQEPSEHGKVFGLAGLAALLGCSRPTAYKLKASGKIPYSQEGRKIVFDSKEVLQAIGRGKNNGKEVVNEK